MTIKTVKNGLRHKRNATQSKLQERSEVNDLIKPSPAEDTLS